MSLYSKLALVKQKIYPVMYDYGIETRGKSILSYNATTISRDFYGDSSPSETTANSIEAIVKFPTDELPTQYGQSQSIYLFEVLPIQIFVKREEDLKKDDAILSLIYDPSLNILTPVFLVIVEELVKYSHYIYSKVFNAALYSSGDSHFTSIQEKISDGEISIISTAESNSIDEVFTNTAELILDTDANDSISDTTKTVLTRDDLDDEEEAESATITINNTDHTFKLYKTNRN